MALARKVDHSALRTHQAIMIAVLLAAFIADLPLLVAFIAVVMVIGAVYPPARLFVLLYQYVLKPAGIVKPDVILDNPEPHRFSMALGGVFTTFSFLSLLAELTVVGWALTLVVVVLAAVNLFLGICVGCLMYYQLNKFGVPGFNQAPIQGGSI